MVPSRSVLPAVVLLAVFSSSVAQSTLSTEGKKFIVYPSRVDGLWDKVTLYITTRSTTPVQVRVYTPLKSVLRGGVDIRRQVRHDRPLTLDVSADNGSHVSKLYGGIVVMAQSDTNIAVLVNNPSSNASGVTSILSEDSLGRRYLFPSIRRPYGAQTSLLIGNTDLNVINEVRVVLPRGQGGPSLQWMDTQYGPGQSFIIKMNRNEFADIRQRDGTGSGDLTGTQIISQKPVAVFSSSVFHPSSAGLSDPAFSVEKDITIENIPPVSSWGKSFAVSASPCRSPGDYVRVLAAHPDVIIRFNNGTTVTLANAGSFFETDIPPGHSFFLQADKPIQVIQYRFDFTQDSAPFMFLVPAVETYSHHYTVPVIFQQTAREESRNYVVLVTHACFADRVTLSHTDTSGSRSLGLVSRLSPWRPVGDSNFLTTEVRVAVGFVTVSIVPADDPQDDTQVTVGGFFFGMGRKKAYAAALGLEWSSEKAKQQWPNTMSSFVSATGEMQWFRSTLVARDKVPFAIPLSTVTVRSRTACHTVCWADNACSHVSYSRHRNPHTLTVCTLLGPTAGCSGFLALSDSLLYRIDKA